MVALLEDEELAIGRERDVHQAEQHLVIGPRIDADAELVLELAADAPVLDGQRVWRLPVRWGDAGDDQPT